MSIIYAESNCSILYGTVRSAEGSVEIPVGYFVLCGCVCRLNWHSHWGHYHITTSISFIPQLIPDTENVCCCSVLVSAFLPGLGISPRIVSQSDEDGEGVHVTWIYDGKLKAKLHLITIETN